MARKGTQKRRTSQMILLIVSILVVLSMALGYVLSTLPTPPPPTPTPTQAPVVFGIVPLLLSI